MAASMGRTASGSKAAEGAVRHSTIGKIVTNAAPCNISTLRAEVSLHQPFARFCSIAPTFRVGFAIEVYFCRRSD
jgi:hypothetical protein